MSRRGFFVPEQSSPTPDPPLSVRRMLVGNWAGSASVAGVVVGVAVLTGLVLTFFSYRDGFSVWQTTVGGVSLGTMAFGADVGGRAHGGGLSVGAVPLTITLLALAGGVVTFRRVTRGCTHAVEALLDALRAAVLAGLVMLVLTLVFRADVAGAQVEASARDGFFLTFLITFVVLGLSVLMRRDWLRHPVSRTVHDWVRGPLIGVVWFLGFLPVAGVIALVSMALFGQGTGHYSGGFSGADWRAALAAVVAYLGNSGLWAVTLGSLGHLGVSGEIADLAGMAGNFTSWGGLGADLPASVGLRYFTGQLHQSGLWVCVALAPAALLLGLSAAVRGGSAVRESVRSIGVFVVVLLVGLPVLIRLADLDLDFDAGPFGDYGGTVGVQGMGAPLLLAGYALILGALLAVPAVVRARQARSRLERAAPATETS